MQSSILISVRLNIIVKLFTHSFFKISLSLSVVEKRFILDFCVRNTDARNTILSMISSWLNVNRTFIYSIVFNNERVVFLMFADLHDSNKTFLWSLFCLGNNDQKFRVYVIQKLCTNYFFLLNLSFKKNLGLTCNRVILHNSKSRKFFGENH